METSQVQSESVSLEPVSDDAITKAQQLRKRRLGMSFASYMATFCLVVFCWYHDLLPGMVAVQYLIFSVLINAAFLLVIQAGCNLRFEDPSMTAAQMGLSLLPALWVMFFLDASQTRAAFLMIAMVPALYGILALSVRQMLRVSLWFFALYALFYLSLLLYRPQALTGAPDMVQTLAFVLVMGQLAIIGGFISGLRRNLRERNDELKGAMERIQELVNIDELTGVYNRRRIFEVLSEEYSRCSRNPGAFSVCLLDIDHFKPVNDNHGHQAGDEILREVARAVAASLRQIDCFGRYGGEEFLLVLPQTQSSGAVIKAERVRATIEALQFPEIAEDFRITVSIGVAEYQPEEPLDTIIARADHALYQAKDSGRNRVVLADASSCLNSAS